MAEIKENGVFLIRRSVENDGYVSTLLICNKPCICFIVVVIIIIIIIIKYTAIFL